MATATALVAGGVAIDGLGRSAAASTLPAFDSCAQLQTWVDRAAATERSHPLSGGDVAVSSGTGAMALDSKAAVPSGSAATSGVAAPSAERTAAGAAAAVGSSATGTNVQEAGVDEPDQVKTDGTHLVGVSPERGLWIAAITKNRPHIVGRLRLPGQPTSLLLAGDRALVMTSQYAYAIERGGIAVDGPAVDLPSSSSDGVAIGRPYGGRNRLIVVDISDVTAPKIVASEEVAGSVVSARQIGSVAWVVTMAQPAIRQKTTPSPSSLLPERTLRDGKGTVIAKGPFMSCSDIRHPIKPAGSQLLSVQPVDMTADTPFTSGRSAGVVAGGGVVYASAKRLYVATNEWGSTSSTQIHAFNISDAKKASYVGSGSVNGTLLSQWSMSEQDGYLRVASTTDGVVPPPGEGTAPSKAFQSQTLVTVLDERGSRLVRVGRVGGLGRGERVWAVRWMGDLAAVVTFRQTDPLYLLDVSKPTAPKLLGSLALTGYSAYLHPVGDGLLLGIGHEADLRGRIENAKATLFDVTDPAHPRKVSNLDLGNGWSDVEGDSHAFTYLPSQKLALLPLSGEDGSVARSISVGAADLQTSGRLIGGDQVQRFVPVGDSVVAMGYGRLASVDPRSLEVLGTASLR